MVDRRQTYFQKNLKTLLKNSGLNYKTFAELCDISEDTVKSYFRKDASLPGAKTLETIAAQFELQYDDLFQADFNMLLQESLERSSYRTQFRNAMIEIGYDSVIAMIDYLQFTGYQISFYSAEAGVNALEAEDAERHFDVLKRNCEKACVEKKQELWKIEGRMEHVEDREEKEGMTEALEEISKQYFEAELELMQIEFCLGTMNEKSKKKNKKYRLGMNRVIGMLWEMAKLPARIRKRRLKELGVYVVLSQSEDVDDYKKIDIYDFYIMCEAFNKSIAEKIAGA